ncbi:MAG: FtsQ-type POTRA domain-containing protein [Verrucomicrobiota bacterium]
MKRKSSNSRSRRRNEKVLHVAVNKKRQSKQNQILVWGGLVGLIFLSATAYGTHVLMKKVLDVVFYENPDFALEQIEITNSGTLSRPEIMDWAGIKKGGNLMKVDLRKVHDRLRSMPYIAGVKVERQLPSILRIIIKERMPVAKLMPYSPKGNLLAQYVYYIDAGGYVMKPKEGEKLKRLPIITGVSIDEVQVGEMMEKEEVLSALNLLRASLFYGLKGDLDLRQLEIQPRGILMVRTNHRGLIRFRIDHLDQQIKRLQTVFNYSKTNHKIIRTVDLTPSRNVPVTFF